MDRADSCPEEPATSWRCRRCGSTAALDLGRVTVRSLRGSFFLCPPCNLRRQPTVLLRYLAIGLVAPLVLALGLAAVDGILWPVLIHPELWGGVLTTLVTWFAAISVFVFAMVSIHELGHAAAARLVGFRVFQLRIGTGPAFQTWVGDVEVRIGLLPLGGLTLATAHQVDGGYWWRRSIVAVAGVMTEAMALIAFLVVDPVPALNSTVVAAMALNWVFNLWPRCVRTSMGTASTDGGSIARAFRADGVEIDREIALGSIVMASALVRRERFDLALRELEAAPEHDGLELERDGLRATALLGRGDVLAAATIFFALHANPARAAGARAGDANNLAWCALLVHRDRGLATALALSAKAFDAMGWEPAIQNTRGLALALAGDVDRGMELLDRSRRAARAPRQRAKVLCTIAIAEARRGNSGGARRAVELARSEDSRSPLLEWADDELTPVEAVPPAPFGVRIGGDTPAIRTPERRPA